MAAEKALEKSSPFRLRRGHRLGPSDAGLLLTYPAGSIGFRFNVRFSTGIGHLHRCRALTVIGAFLVLAANVTSGVANGLDQLQRIGMMRRCQPGNLHIEIPFILRERALKNARGNRTRDFAAVSRSTLDHDRDHIFRVIKWSETGKPGDVFLVASVGRLGRSGFSGDDHIFQTCPAARSSIFVDNFP